jgi:hypothetical protein
MRDLSRTRLVEKMRSERAMYSRRSLQSRGTLTIEDGRHMVRRLDDDECAKAVRFLKRQEEKDLKMSKKWVEAAAKNCTCMAEEREIEAIVYCGCFWQRESWYAVEFIFMFFLSVG